MRLPEPPSAYNRLQEIERNRTLEIEDKKNRKIDGDVEVGDERLILKSPDGTRWNATVDNAGNWVLTSI